MRERPKALTLTDAAADRVRALMAMRDHDGSFLRLGVETKGCSGLSYKMEYVQQARPLDEIVEDKGVRIYIDPKAVMFVLGTEVDYVEDKFQSGFVFRNPLEKGRCGCGESFHV